MPEISDFIQKYQKEHQLNVVTFCGGEVFTLKYFPHLVNKLVHNGIFIQVITNGTIDRLKEFTSPNNVNLIVSIDGLRAYHDANRGVGNFNKSVNFLKKAHRLSFHTEIFSIVTRENFWYIDEFEEKLNQELGFKPRITYHPRKPPSYLLHHPVSNIFGRAKNFNFLTDEQMVKIMKEKNTFPPKNLGCYQIALASDRKVYGCCEGTIPLGKKSDKMSELFHNLEKRIILWEKTNRLTNCLGCSQPDFMCGIKQYLPV